MQAGLLPSPGCEPRLPAGSLRGKPSRALPRRHTGGPGEAPAASRDEQGEGSSPFCRSLGAKGSPSAGTRRAAPKDGGEQRGGGSQDRPGRAERRSPLSPRRRAGAKGGGGEEAPAAPQPQAGAAAARAEAAEPSPPAGPRSGRQGPGERGPPASRAWGRTPRLGWAHSPRQAAGTAGSAWRGGSPGAALRRRRCSAPGRAPQSPLRALERGRRPPSPPASRPRSLAPRPRPPQLPAASAPWPAPEAAHGTAAPPGRQRRACRTPAPPPAAGGGDPAPPEPARPSAPAKLRGGPGGTPQGSRRGRGGGDRGPPGASRRGAPQPAAPRGWLGAVRVLSVFYFRISKNNFSPPHSQGRRVLRGHGHPQPAGERHSHGATCSKTRKAGFQREKKIK